MKYTTYPSGTWIIAMLISMFMQTAMSSFCENKTTLYSLEVTDEYISVDQIFINALGNDMPIYTLFPSSQDRQTSTSISTEMVDNNGSTPLHISAGKGNSKDVELLLTAGADAQRTDNSGELPLAKALAAYACKNLLTTAITTNLLLLMDNTYRADSLSWQAKDLLKKYAFDTGTFGIILKHSKILGKKHHQEFSTTLISCRIPEVLIELIIAYYDCFEARKLLFRQAINVYEKQQQRNICKQYCIVQ